MHPKFNTVDPQSDRRFTGDMAGLMNLAAGQSFYRSQNSDQNPGRTSPWPILALPTSNPQEPGDEEEWEDEDEGDVDEEDGNDVEEWEEDEEEWEDDEDWDEDDDDDDEEEEWEDEEDWDEEEENWEDDDEEEDEGADWDDRDWN